MVAAVGVADHRRLEQEGREGFHSSKHHNLILVRDHSGLKIRGRLGRRTIWARNNRNCPQGNWIVMPYWRWG